MKRLAAITALACLFAAAPSRGAMDSLDHVPAATLLLPYFEIDPAVANANRTVFTVGNVSPIERLAHVTLWTDRGVPTYTFEVRLGPYETVPVDLRDLFVLGTLPATSAGAFPGCVGRLPPPALTPTQLTGLRNAHSGFGSTLLGGMCGGVAYGDGRARGYATVDVVNACTTLVPGNAGYFTLGGLGIARNDNVLWGEYSTYAPNLGLAYGDAMVHIEANAGNAATNDAGDYTFYARRVNASAADNREGLPQMWMGRHAMQGPISTTVAIVWRDPGNVAPFNCNAPPPRLGSTQVVAFDQQENPSLDAPGADLPFATQAIDLGNPAQAAVPYANGFLLYGLGRAAPDGTLGTRNQAHVSHLYHSAFGDAGLSAAWPLGPITDAAYVVPAQPAQCGDGIDNDGDGAIDFPADPGCAGPNSFNESPACSNLVNDDGDGATDFPADDSCRSPSSPFEVTDCSDGADNDFDGFTDAADPQCTARHDLQEVDGPQCYDGIDNDGDGRIDFIDGGGGDPHCSFYVDNLEAQGLCSDLIDNDGDGLVDFPNDPGCSFAGSNQENPQCDDDLDNDGDGLVDFPADPSCAAASSTAEARQCSDGIDNDGDGRTDFPADDSCASPAGSTESTHCSDGIDNDGDGSIDFPADTGCTSRIDTSEVNPPQCSDGIDNNSNGVVDFPLDPGCTTASDTFEGPDCNDGADNDFDGLVDTADPGCSGPADVNELAGATTRACRDGLDNDNDGRIDFPLDTGCASAWDDVEFVPGGDELFANGFE